MRLRDLKGQAFGQLTVLAQATSRQQTDRLRVMWLCKCACGAELTVSGTALVSGNTITCGGCKRGARKQRHGLSASATYSSWKAALSRCYNPNNVNYRHYGGRGIVMCEEWRLSFPAFYRDMGPKPSSMHTIEREDVDGNYEPNNCMWATEEEQARSKRNNHRVVFRGEVMCLTDVAALSDQPGMTAAHLFHRLQGGLTLEEALTRPIHFKITPDIAQQIWDCRQRGSRAGDLSRDFGVSPQIVQRICSGRTFPDIKRNIWIGGLRVPLPGVPRLRPARCNQLQTHS